MSNFCCKTVAARCHQYIDSEKPPFWRKDERREFLTKLEICQLKKKHICRNKTELNTKQALSLEVIKET